MTSRHREDPSYSGLHSKPTQDETIEFLKRELGEVHVKLNKGDGPIKKYAPLVSVAIFVLSGGFAWYNQVQDHETQIRVLEAKINGNSVVSDEADIRSRILTGSAEQLDKNFHEFIRYQHMSNERQEAMLEAIVRKLRVRDRDIEFKEEDNYRSTRTRIRSEGGFE